MTGNTITIARRFHGPKNSGNGGYVCGRLAAFIDGPARVRLHTPPPLDIPLEVRVDDEGVALEHGDSTIAQAWPTTVEIDPPLPPTVADAEAAAARFRGFRSHRFASCFVCGPDRKPGDGLRIFAGPLADSTVLACTWTPGPELTTVDQNVAPGFVWCVLDCPGGFAFPEPPTGTILLGELSVALHAPAKAGEIYIVTAWELSSEGRKHYTGTALFSRNGQCLALGHGTWFEVEDGVVE